MAPEAEHPSNEASSTLVSATAKAIRGLILSRELLPGEQLRQAELAQRLQVSRIPVREALSTLIAERIVAYHPQRGFFVNKLDAESFRQLRLMRNLLESAALRELDWPDEKEIDALVELNDRIERAGVAGKLDEMRELNSEFHSRILSFSRLNLIVEEIETLRLIADLYRWLYVWDDGARERSHAEHLTMIEALRRHNTETLVAARNSHAGVFENAVMSRLPLARPGVS